MNLRATDLIRDVAEYLRVSGIESAESEAKQIVESASGLERRRLLISQNFVDEGVQRRSLELAARRASGEPLQYVTGSVGFRNIELSVGPGVFIPRPETETVVEHAIKRLPPDGIVADIGAGSGAIALALAHERPDLKIYATDSSPEALAWCRKNVASLQLQIELFEGDLFTPLPIGLAGQLDAVVSNPPYIAENELAQLEGSIVNHEPHEALLAAEGGLAMIKRIALEAREWLRTNGWLLLEIGETQGDRAHGLLTEVGYERVVVRKDLAARDRVVEGQWPGQSR